MGYKKYKRIDFEIGDFNGHVGKKVDGFEGVHGGNGIGQQNLEGTISLEFCDQKDLCMANTWFKKNEKRRVTFNLGGNETDIDFVLLIKERTKFLKDAKVIHWELQHRLVVIGVKKENLFKRMRIKRNMQWRV